MFTLIGHLNVAIAGEDLFTCLSKQEKRVWAKKNPVFWRKQASAVLEEAEKIFTTTSTFSSSLINQPRKHLFKCQTQHFPQGSGFKKQHIVDVRRHRPRTVLQHLQHPFILDQPVSPPAVIYPRVKDYYFYGEGSLTAGLLSTLSPLTSPVGQPPPPRPELPPSVEPGHTAHAHSCLLVSVLLLPS